MKKNTKGKRKNKKKIIVFILVLLLAGGLIYMAVKPNNNTKIDKGKKVVDKIDNFDYKVSETDTELFKKEFKKLKTTLSRKEVDNKEYSSSVAKLFIIDFFTLDNKVTKNDIGGVQFVYSNYKTTFIDKARDEFYKYVKSNLDGNRTQELPIVETITVDSIDAINASDKLSTDEFSSIDEAYKVNLTWTYKKDLGYQTSATVTVVKDNNKFSVAKLESLN